MLIVSTVSVYYHLNTSSQTRELFTPSVGRFLVRTLSRWRETNIHIKHVNSEWLSETTKDPVRTGPLNKDIHWWVSLSHCCCNYHHLWQETMRAALNLAWNRRDLQDILSLPWVRLFKAARFFCVTLQLSDGRQLTPRSLLSNNLISLLKALWLLWCITSSKGHSGAADEEEEAS